MDSSCDCDPFRRTLRICVRDTQSASETCAFDYHMQDAVALGIALHHDQLLRRAYRLCSISGDSCSYCALLDLARLCISNTCAQGIRSFQRFGDWSCRMPCIVVSDNLPRRGMFLPTFAHFVARSIVLHLRFFGERMAYADSFGWAFARRMSSCSACVALSVRTCASFLAMPRFRAKRTVFLAR